MYSLTGFETFLVYWSAPDGAPLEIEITVANATTPMVRDPLTGTSQAPTRMQKGPQDNRLRLALPAADHPLIVDFNFGNSSSLGTTVDVRKEALPRVEEIIFRHQQAQAAQDAVLRNYIAHVRIEQHFHPSPADPAYNLVTENRLFSDHGAVEWEELSFELNGAKWTANRPAFPLVQPEKVLSLPLDLRLNQDYAYRLDGRRHGRRTAGVRRPVRPGRCDARALSRDGVDRPRDVRPAQGSGGRDEAERSGRLERRDAGVRAGRRASTAGRSGCSIA